MRVLTCVYCISCACVCVCITMYYICLCACVYTLLSPNVTRSVVMISWFTRYYCACAPMLYISELCEDCAIANEIDYEMDDV